MFGERLKKLRKEKGLVQEGIAALLNVSPSTVGMYEQGRRDPDTETVRFLATYFNVSTDYLLGQSDIRETPEKRIIEAAFQEKTLGDALVHISNLVAEYDMPDDTLLHLWKLAISKFGKPPKRFY